MQLILIGLLAAVIMLAGTANAYAEPITIALFGAAFAATTAGAVVTFAISTAISIGLSLVAQALTKKDQQQAADPGITFDVQMGDTVPMGFPLGETATAGSREYIGSWGNDGGTPNAYLVDVRTISDIPLPGQPGIWIDDTKCTILWGETPVAQGYPILEKRVGGVDHAWVKYKDGTQTTAEEYLLDKFGTHPDRPWTDDMIGRGCAFMIVTTLVNREIFNGEPKTLFEPPVSRWYDVRKDSTAGGDGDHRWGDWSTYEPTTNNMVVAYNIARGVFYGSEWIFGGQNLAAFRLPSANWIAAANACDEDIDLSEGGTEPAYRCGMYVNGDLEPLAVIDELRKGCNATIAEDGGIFRAQVGEPGSAVYAFTDDDILVTEGQSYEPFPNLDNTNNIIEGIYPEPREQWRDKDAPQRRNDLAVIEDGDRELVASVKYTATPYANQVQRLMDAALKDARRFRVHSFWLPPDAWALSAGTDRVSWTSARNGYSSKKFKIVRITGRRNSNQLVMLKEVDASDFDWSTDYELPEATGVIGPLPVPAQPMAGWQVFPATINDNSGTGKRPTIRVTFDGNQDDVRAVRIQVRTDDASEDIVFDGEVPYGEITGTEKSVILNATLIQETDYEARGRFIPYSARPTEWSEWLAVTTPAVPEVDLSPTERALLLKIEELEGELRPMKRDIATLAETVIQEQQITEERRGQLYRGIGTAFGENKALIERTDLVVATIDAALAEIFESAYATTAGGEAESLVKIAAASSTTEGALALIRIAVRAGFGGQMCEAALEMAAMYSAELGYHTRVAVIADYFDMKVKVAGNYVTIPAKGLRRGDETKTLSIVSGSPNTFQIDLRELHQAFYLNLTANAKPLFPLGGWNGAEATLFVRNNGSYTFEDPDLETFILPSSGIPQPKTGSGAITVYGMVMKLEPLPEWSLYKKTDGATTAGSVTVFGISPAVGGKNIWNLLTDGDLVLDGPGTWTITPLGERLDCDAILIGLGGNSGGIKNYFNSPFGFATNPSAAADSTFGTMVVQAGRPSAAVSVISTGYSDGAVGAGGTASDGDTNTTGANGTSGAVSFGSYAYAGNGKGVVGYSADVTADYLTNLAIRDGKPGNSPGGGAAGAAYVQNGPYGYTTGGGGAAGKAERRYNSSSSVKLLQGIAYQAVLPSQGALPVYDMAKGALGGQARLILKAIP